MIQHVTGRVVDGTLKLDESVRLPNQSRVTVVIQSEQLSDKDRRLAVDRFLAFMQQHAVNDGEPFSREALYDRN